MGRETDKQCRKCAYWGTKHSMTAPTFFRPTSLWWPCVACNHRGRTPLLYPAKNFYRRAEPSGPKKK